MIIWTMYDIENNKIRSKVAKCCLQAGLYRVQKSVFLGTLDSQQKDALRLMIEDWINPDTDSVYIFPMSKDELRETDLLGQAFDKDLVTDQIKALFL